MKYVIKKLVSSIITLFAVALLVFLAFAVIPGDPALARLGTNATESALNKLREEMGLNRPLIVRFFEWILGALRGDFGTSYSYNMPVIDLIKDKLPITLTITLFALVIMLLIAIPVGVLASYREDTALDHFIQVVNQVMMAIPPFFSGILITLLFGVTLKLFAPGGYVSPQVSMGNFLSYMIYPALAIAIPKAAMVVNLLYSSLNGEKRKDYVRTAYSRGNSSGRVFFGHMLKNASMPVITFLGMALADMIAGSIIIEQVFGIPGMGRILLTSIQHRDYPVVEAIIVLIAVCVIGCNLLVDILYRLVDPRVEK